MEGRRLFWVILIPRLLETFLIILLRRIKARLIRRIRAFNRKPLFGWT